jgi:Protein of unknown function (DUF2971)
MKLFKYLHPNRIDVLESLNIRLTQATDFNDPFDLSPLYGMFSKEDLESFDDILDDNGQKTDQKLVTPEVWAQVRSATSKGFAALQKRYSTMEGMYMFDNNEMARLQLSLTYGVLSLCEHHDNLLMWAHYADYHRGFVIEFDTQNVFFGDLNIVKQPSMLGKVEYSDVRPHLSYSTIGRPEALLRKSAAWAYEQEWRLIKHLVDADTRIDRQGDPEICLFRFPAGAVSAIYTGAKMKLEDYYRLTRIPSEQKGMAHVRLHHMQLSGEEFQLVTSPPLPSQEDPMALSGRVVMAHSFRV